MIEALVERILEDVTKICWVVEESRKLTHPLDPRMWTSEKMYSSIRQNLLDTIREMELGGEVDWDELNAILPRLNV